MASLIEQFAASSHLSGGNAAFVEALYERFLVDPATVDPAWRAYFESLRGRDAGDVPHGPIVEAVARSARSNGHASAALGAPADSVQAQKQAGVLRLVTAYRARGHLGAKLDPLGLAPRPAAPDLEPSFHGLGGADLQAEFATGSLSAPARMKLADIISLLKRTYADTIGAEFMHIADGEQRRWMHERLERHAGNFGFDAAEKRRTLLKLTQAEGLERYLHTKYVGQKRFSLEGGDALIPLMDDVIRRAGGDGVREIVIGMAHRGRLNVLVNTLGKPSAQLFAEFEGKHDDESDPAHSGDVKYHMGFSSDVATPGGPVHLALGFNPSHLEIIDPVVAGSVRARQNRRDDRERSQVMPVLIHGDAAFAGQGVVMELFQMSQARGFAVGGTVHVVVNNQVGFTISRPDDARSTLYCTDVAKMLGTPVLHVNGDDAEAVRFCAQIAYDFRARFKRDVVIDLVCYRRHGHNEADEPAATQPVMYQVIRAHRTPRERYAERLASEGVVVADEAQAMVDAYRATLEQGGTTTELAQSHPVAAVDWSRHLHAPHDPVGNTALPRAKLDALAAKIVAVPAGFVLQSRVAKVYEDRARMMRGELALDWGYAENLAYASLLAEGHKLRLVGQDTGRGTFFHRHAVLHDQKTGRTHIPLCDVAPDDRAVWIVDSLLSEEAVMAFEYGYSTTDPQTLVIWEAQFGDFANGAQVVIDQFISSGEAKWGRLSGLTLLLPHGYEGQGPEHSSARLERFLQLCALNNMQVCYPTTPAQMFHMLRRQMVRDLRKPLVVMSPKSMLRHKLSTSTLDDLAGGSFQLMIPDTTSKDPKKTQRVVLCSGKVYYDLVEDAAKRKVTDVAIVRVEQLFPFPRSEVRAELARHASAKQIVWCQEEPQNQGAWYQIQHHLQNSLVDKQKLYYAGRPRSPAPACGHHSTHVVEQAGLVEYALVARLNGEAHPD
ncbi:MAG TPA: 2-oxoglutarate dehydrogenase E1 component [Candidatus Saccharimonadia bacterium]|nr:2-oxoglutarate dehydrogenase E1 component [Candidatus Saccharimonadia bacterium]